MPEILQILFCAVPVSVCCFFAARSMMHYFQLESYQFPGYFRALKRNSRRVLLPSLCCAAFALLCAAQTLTGASAMRWICAAVLLLASYPAGKVIARAFSVQKAKKKFAVTARVKRLMGFFAVFLLLVSALLYAASPWLTALSGLLLPFILALAGLCAWPVEKLISELYFRDARRKLLSMPDLIRIGITGSYGKTSVKFILDTILSEKYNVLVTPSSFNTPMGLTRVIRSSLNAGHQVFLAEMGARHVGDIRELCRLVHPTMGVLTSVGPQHLETFKTLDRIASTKYELIDALPEDGCAFFADDGSTVRGLYEKTAKPRVLSAVGNPDADVYADEVTVSPRGSSFLLHTGLGEILCETRMLGAHNISNIVLAVSVAVRLGLTLNQIKRGIAKVAPVEHRLQLMDMPNGYTVIDDAFNANPRGANAALDVLGAFRDCRRVIVTPGMVELGAEEDEFNRSFGRKMASCVDEAFLIGRRHAQPIADGLREAGFMEEHIHLCGSLDEAMTVLRPMLRLGDVVLYENDLPDNYQDA